ncbi:hypothetical protein ACU6RQ_18005 [Zobellella denitrificans]
MKGNIIGEIFGFIFTRPIEDDLVVRLVYSFPDLAMKRVEENGISEREAVDDIKNEFLNFINNMNEDDSSEFLKIAEPALLAKESEYASDSVNVMDPDKTKWNFYIRFKVSESLGVDKKSLMLLDQFVIEADGGKSLKEEKVLVLRNKKSLIHREILPLSKKVEQILILAFAELGIGIAYPGSLASGFILDKIRKEMESTFISHHTKVFDGYYEIPLIHFSDKFGVELFQEESLPWDSNATEEKESSDVTLLENTFVDNYNHLKYTCISGDHFRKIELASSILATSIYEDSLVSKIILSMTVIEVLSEKTCRDNEEIRALDFLVQSMNEANDFDQKVKDSLTRTLESMKFQSIGKSCRSLVKRLLGKKDSKLFYDLYDYRSQLVHTGSLKDDHKEMYKIYSDSFVLAKKTLSKYIQQLSKAS